MIRYLLFLMLVSLHHAYAGVPTVKLESSKQNCGDDGYVKDYKATGELDGDQATVDVEYTIVKEIPQSAMCSFEFLEKVDGKDEKMDMEISPEPCCDMILKHETYMDIVAKGNNVPKSCPFAPGTYQITKYTMGTEGSNDVPPGTYTMKFLMSDKDSGECLYGSESVWSVTKND